MTDELTIQQQQPKSKVLPYAATGVVAGGALGGWRLPKWTAKKVTVEDLVNEQTSKDRFQKAEDYEALENARSEVKKAEEAVVEASKAKIDPSLPEARELKAAQDAFKRAQEGAGNAEKFDPYKLKAFKELGMEDLPTTYTGTGRRAGKPIKPSAMEGLYNSLSKDVVNAHRALDTRLDAGVRGTQNRLITEITNMQNTHQVALAGKTDAQVQAYFNNTISYDSHGNKIVSPQYQSAINLAESKIPMPTALTNDEIKAIGTIVDSKAPVTPGMNRISITTRNASGRGFTTEVIEYDGKAYADALAQKKAATTAARESMAEELFRESQNAFNIQKQIDTLAKDVGDNVERELCEKTGLYDASKDVLDIKKIISDGKDYEKDIKALKKGLKTKAYDPAIVGKYTTLKTPGAVTKAEAQKALEAVQARADVFKQYSEQLEGLTEELKQTRRANEAVRKLDEEIADVIAKDKATQKADQAFREQFPNLYKETEGATSEVPQAIKDRLAKAEEAYAKVAEKSGKVDAAAKETAEKGVAEAKGKITKLAEEMIGRVKNKPGMKAGAGIAVGAGTLGLLAALIAPKNKNS